MPFSSPIESSATRGSVHAEDSVREDRAHPRVLGEVLGGRVGVRADVEEDHGSSVGRHLDRQRGPVDAGQASESEDGGGHAGARVAGGDEGLRAALLHEVGCDEDRRVLLLAERLRRMLVHPDDLGGVDDLGVRRELARDRSDGVGVTDEEDSVLRMLASA